MGTPHQLVGTCSKITLKTLKRRQSRCCGAFSVNFEQILHIVLVFSWLNLNN